MTTGIKVDDDKIEEVLFEVGEELDKHNRIKLLTAVSSHAGVLAGMLEGSESVEDFVVSAAVFVLERESKAFSAGSKLDRAGET